MWKRTEIMHSVKPRCPKYSKPQRKGRSNRKPKSIGNWSRFLTWLFLALFPDMTLDQVEKILENRNDIFTVLQKAVMLPFSRKRFAKVLTLLGYRKLREGEIFIGEKRRLLYHGQLIERIIPWSSRRSQVYTERAWEDVQHFFLNEYGIEVSKENRPTVNGRHISLAGLVLEILRKELGFSQPLFIFDSPKDSCGRNKKKRQLLFQDIATSGIFDDFEQLGQKGTEFLQNLFIEIGIVKPPEIILDSLAEWLKNLSLGESSQIVSVICPDYEVNEAGMYTFENLGTGVGKVAGKILSAYPKLIDFFKKYGLLENIQFVMLIAETEADLDWNVKRLGISKEEFLMRIAKSLQRIKQEVPVEIQDRFYAMNLTDVVGKNAWSQIFEQAIYYAEGDIVVPKEREQERIFLQNLVECGISEIAYSKRLNLYHRWCIVDGNFDEDLAKELFIHQKAEHMTSAKIITQSSNNPFVIQGESPWLSIWWQFLIPQILPVIYLE